MTINILCLIVGTLIFIYYIKKYKQKSYWTNRNVPCENIYPPLGSIPNMLTSSVHQYLLDLYKKYDGHPCFGLYLLETPCLVLRCPELIKTVMVKEFSKFCDRPFAIDKRVDPLAGSSIVAIKNPEWKLLRAKLTPIFTPGKLKLMVSLMNHTAEAMVDYLRQHVGENVDVKEVLKKYHCDLTCSCTFGVESNCFKDEGCSEIQIYGNRMFTVGFWRKLCMLGYFLAPALVRMLKFSFIDFKTSFRLHQIFAEILEERKKNNMKRNDFVDMLNDLKNYGDEHDIFSDEFLISSQALTFFAASVESTSRTLSFALYEMAMNPGIQDRARREVDDVLERHENVICYEALSTMQYLNGIIYESLRKYGLSSFLIRECTENCQLEPYGIKIEAGTYVLIPTSAIHTDPNFYKDPMIFNPDRFTEENRKDLIPYAFLGFGVGPRNCLGERFALLQAKVGMVHILKAFKIMRSSQTPDQLRIDHKALLFDILDGIPLVFKDEL